MNAVATPAIENLTLNINQEIHVRASLETTFAALLEQLGPENEGDNGKMPMKLEAWPGGRWFRDLGEGNGHFWANVQAIKRPTLLEFSGLQLAVPAQPGGGRNPDHLPPFSARLCSRRIPQPHQHGLVTDSRAGPPEL